MRKRAEMLAQYPKRASELETLLAAIRKLETK
jgi:hypothetical protein